MYGFRGISKIKIIKSQAGKQHTTLNSCEGVGGRMVDVHFSLFTPWMVKVEYWQCFALIVITALRMLVILAMIVLVCNLRQTFVVMMWNEGMRQHQAVRQH